MTIELKPYTHVAEELDAETGKYALYAYSVDGNRTPVDDTELVYLKSNVDKVIEAKDKEIRKLKEQVALLQAEFIPQPGV